MPLHPVDIHDKSEFKPTPEELRSIGEKMKDPKFMELLRDYMSDLQNPEYRKEEEEYLKQVEKEAKEGGDYSFEFIFPKPEWVAELLQVKSHGRTFINMCHCEKVDEFREETTGDKTASRWHVPVSVGREREEDYEGKKVAVFDAVFHPKTLMLSNRSDRFMCFLVEIAVEHINGGYSKGYGFEFKRLSGVVSVGTPQNQTVKKKEGKSPFAISPDVPMSHAPMKPEEPKTAVTQPKASAKPTGALQQGNSKATAAKEPASLVPKHTIAHRGEVDLTDAWNWKISDKRIGVPSELVVKIEFPGVKSAAVLDVDVEGAYIEIHRSTSHKFAGSILLPFSVDSTPSSARFDKIKQVLTLVLSVVPPQLPEGAVTAEELRAEQQQGIREVPEEEGLKEKEPLDNGAGPTAVEPVEIAKKEAQLPDTEAEPEQEQTETLKPEKGKKVTFQEPKKELEELPPPPPLGDVQQLMQKLQAAREEREKAEKEETTEKPQQPEAGQDGSEEKKAEEGENKPEVIDLRKRQQEWLAQQQAAASGAADPVVVDNGQEEDEDPEAAREARRKRREARKKIEAEREAEQLEAKMQAKMAELPLRSKLIFEIE